MTNAFADRIRQRFPEGLTGIMVIGGTRTSYVLQHNRDSENPGLITDMRAYVMEMLGEYFKLIDWFYDLGGQNLVIPPLAYQRFMSYDRQYMAVMTKMTLLLTEGFALDYYRQHDVDPYFAGIDTLLKLPADHPAHQLAVALGDFQRAWEYQPGRRKLLWEIAPIPLYTFWNLKETLDPAEVAEVDAALAATDDLEQVYQTLYRVYARAVLGTDMPVPHFYLGTNRNGDLKLRSMAPISLLNGSATRFYYTPYPTLFITYETLQAIVEDVAFGTTMSTSKADYDERFTSDMANAEYERNMALSADPRTTIGFVRSLNGAFDTED